MGVNFRLESRDGVHYDGSLYGDSYNYLKLSGLEDYFYKYGDGRYRGIDLAPVLTSGLVSLLGKSVHCATNTGREFLAHIMKLVTACANYPDAYFLTYGAQMPQEAGSDTGEKVEAVEMAGPRVVEQTSPRGLPLLHIYHAHYPHQRVVICGMEKGLDLLRFAVHQALKEGDCTVSDLFHADGEGYTLQVANVNEREIEALTLPYTAEHALDGRGLDAETYLAMRLAYAEKMGKGNRS